MKERDRRQGIVVVNTGEGKGKSSSAFGMVFRAAGWGMKVCVIQYIKGKWQTGEHKAAERFDNIEWHVLGDGFTWDTKTRSRILKPAGKSGNLVSRKYSRKSMILFYWMKLIIVAGITGSQARK